MPVHTHTQAYTHMHILVPLQDRKTMGLKVDIADNVNFVMWHVPGLHEFKTVETALFVQDKV